MVNNGTVNMVYNDIVNDLSDHLTSTGNQEAWSLNNHEEQRPF